MKTRPRVSTKDVEGKTQSISYNGFTDEMGERNDEKG